jgi:hypothetical protein
MPTSFARLVGRGLKEGVANAVRRGDTRTDFRAALCRFEDDLFAAFPVGHGLIEYAAASSMIAEIFTACGCRVPTLALVPGFDDPRVGGFADVANHRIAIERGYLYRFLVLHESAHLLVPQDRRHGPAFTYLLQLLYRSFIGIPEEAIHRFLSKHGLPSYTAAPGEAAMAMAG